MEFVDSDGQDFQTKSLRVTSKINIHYCRCSLKKPITIVPLAWATASAIVVSSTVGFGDSNSAMRDTRLPGCWKRPTLIAEQQAKSGCSAAKISVSVDVM